MIYALLSRLLSGEYPESSLVFEILSKSIYASLMTVNVLLIVALLIKPFPWLRRFKYHKRCVTALVIGLASVLMTVALYFGYLQLTRFSVDISERCKVFDFKRDYNKSPMEDGDYRIVFTCDNDDRHEKSYLDGTHAFFYELHFLDNQIARECQTVRDPIMGDMPVLGQYSCGGKVFERMPLSP